MALGAMLLFIYNLTRIFYEILRSLCQNQGAEIKRCLKAHIIKSSDEMLDDLIQRSGYNPRR